MEFVCRPKPYLDLAVAIKNEQRFSLEVIKTIAEAQKRSIHLKEGYPSMFSLLTKKFGYSDSAACRRIKVARCIKQIPEMDKALKERSLDITAAALIAGLKDPKQIKEVLSESKSKSYREIETLVRAKQPEMLALQRDKIKTISVIKLPESSEAEFPSKSFCNQQSGVLMETETKLRVEFTASKALEDKITRAKELLSGKHPGGASLEQVFEAALDEFIAKEEKAPRKSKESKNPRYIPTELRREVMKRDNHCCSFKSERGKACDSKWDLEIDHIQPFSKGGKTEVGNLRVLCRAHNLYLAEEVLGEEFVRGRIDSLVNRCATNSRG